ncbi:MAG: hypothetical protein F6J95_032165 [Leptolyngbya sp. SIO1E4]|nr:hypothetical protein [Leptolyngbya sp. SIO1E4]
MNRRDFLGGSLAAIGVWPVVGHTPFPQWKVYRQVHLFIVVNRADAAACDLGRAIAHTLATELPASRARVTRARDALRLASLISTHQLDLALLHRSELTVWQQGESPFNQIEPVALQELFAVENYVLISRQDFRPEHASLVKHTLEAHPNSLFS